MSSTVCRLEMGLGGLKISKPGQDARSASDIGLLFSTLFPQMIQLGAGTFTQADPISTIVFLTPSSRKPRLFCGLLDTGGLRWGGPAGSSVAPVRTVFTTSGGNYTGFVAYPMAGYGGTKHAVGQTVTWTAFLLG